MANELTTTTITDGELDSLLAPDVTRKSEVAVLLPRERLQAIVDGVKAGLPQSTPNQARSAITTLMSAYGETDVATRKAQLDLMVQDAQRYPPATVQAAIEAVTLKRHTFPSRKDWTDALAVAAAPYYQAFASALWMLDEHERRENEIVLSPEQRARMAKQADRIVRRLAEQ